MLTDADLHSLSDLIAAKLAERLDARRLIDRPELARLIAISERCLGGPVARHELVPGSWSGGRRGWQQDEIRKVLAGRQGRPRRRDRGIRSAVRSRFQGLV